jgi:hypothetical protein
MTSDPRAALATLISALERHLEAAASKRDEEDPTVLAAYEDVADAFEAYDEALLTAYGEMTPLDLYDDSEDEDEDGEDGEDGEIDDHYSDEDGEESIYSGLDDEEYDTDDDEDQTGS